MAAALPLALFVLQEAVQAIPAIEAELRTLFARPAITAADWQALHARLAAKDYFAYVPASTLPLMLQRVPTV